ncbi:hypothetical protein LX32DRAFT_411249 [Colletotrichum zoysiae]|uniref:Uncharacterized protein n=1 Tax=Colletotrichum zoysiae TaxID=1216348 RepID=A0AAD9LZB6_9PEZI|nr:hypothetical protein LX32DRAFT_411249 [Colletotrichum zoysiae]
MVDERLTPNLITHAAHFARSISQPSIYESKTLKKSLDQLQLAGCLRFLHTVESFHATCNGLLPMLNPAAIEDITDRLDGNQWQQAECAATSTLAMIFERLYGSNALQESAACRKLDIQACEALLHKWRLGLPQPFNKIHEEWSEDFCKPRLWRAAQRLMVRYYSGVFLVFCPWLSVSPDSRSSYLLDAECLARCRSQCFKAACSFLHMADHVSRSNVALEGMFFDLLTISLYLVVWGTVSGGLEQKRECMSCLCIAYGILGRMFLFQGEIPHGVFTLLKRAISKFEERPE